MADPNDNVSREVEYGQVNTTIRHYGYLRLLMIPIFVLINGGLLNAIGGANKVKFPLPMYFDVGFFAVVISIVFIYWEHTINIYRDNLVKYAIKINRNSHWKALPTGNRISYSIRLLYVLVSLSWLALAVFKNRTMFF